MKRLIFLLTTILFIAFLTACGGNNNTNDDTAPNNDNDSENPALTNNSADENNTNSEEDQTELMNEENDQDYMRSHMEELDFYEFSLEVTYEEDQEFEASIDQDRNESIDAEVEDELNNEFSRGIDAFDYIFTRIQPLNLTSDQNNEEVIEQTLKVFELSEDYREFDLEIEFKDGNELNIENKQ
ncbi:MAG TPA: YusW family protein [Pseudogracilibacillus sp.]|nr:YusW family protein [Pseudogracilibacillus sp.]